jgi:preprotein translocase subunit YajC
MDDQLLGVALALAWGLLMILVLTIPDGVFTPSPRRGTKTMTKREFKKLSAGDRIETSCGWTGEVVGIGKNGRNDYIIVNLDDEAPGLTRHFWREAIKRKV